MVVISIGTIRREYLKHIFFLNSRDLENKLNEFKDYYNSYRVHSSLDGKSPCEFGDKIKVIKANLKHFNWKRHCRGLFQTPIAA